MKKLLSFAFVASLCLSLFATDIFNYVPLSGNIKNYTRTDYTIASKFGNYFRTPNVKIVKSFNNLGKEVESSELTPKDTVINKITTAYDVRGNITEQAGFNSDNELVWKSVVSYKNNLKADVSEYDAKGTLKGKIIYAYDNGKLVDETGYDGDGALIWKNVSKYSETGALASVCEYNSDGSLFAKVVYTYTDDGKTDTITTYQNLSKESKQQVFRYGSNGLLSEITTYTADKVVCNRLVLKYDSANNVIKVSEYEVSEKFGTTCNDLVAQSDFSYQF